jgi:uncharacterized membrane protein
MDIFKYFCHQNPKRTLSIKGHYFPVCARCTGFYISIFVYTIFAMCFSMNYTLSTTILGFLLLIPCGIDGISQLFELIESNNILRLITGLLGGLGLWWWRSYFNQ